LTYKILALARLIEVELRYSDIDYCIQVSSSHQFNAALVFVKFVSRWMRDEFYLCYLHCVKGKAKRALKLSTFNALLAL
jgi:hypothetical protein